MSVDHLEYFLDLKLHFEGEKTIKFFDPVNAPTYQNSLLIHQPTRTILDMKIQDPDIFQKISDNFSKQEPEEVDEKEKQSPSPDPDAPAPSSEPQPLTSFKLTTNIDVYSFVEKILSPSHKMVGFITKGYNKFGDDGFVLPGTQMFNYQIR
jgi:hypothetical protein